MPTYHEPNAEEARHENRLNGLLVGVDHDAVPLRNRPSGSWVGVTGMLEWVSVTTHFYLVMRARGYGLTPEIIFTRLRGERYV